MMTKNFAERDCDIMIEYFDLATKSWLDAFEEECEWYLGRATVIAVKKVSGGFLLQTSILTLLLLALGLYVHF